MEESKDPTRTEVTSHQLDTETYTASPAVRRRSNALVKALLKPSHGGVTR